MRLIEKVWFQQHRAKWFLLPLLLPLSAVFWLLSFVRRFAYRHKIFTSHHLNKPVIVVGNIGVGGNGKTPVVIYLVELAKTLGLNPGVISRGYGGKADVYPYLLNDESSAAQAGDEPILIYKRCHVPVVVGADRVENAQLLVEQGCDVIISDDGLQHYKLARDFEIIVIDSKRMFGNGFLLPSGPLREGIWRLSKGDLLIFNGKRKHGNNNESDKNNVEIHAGKQLSNPLNKKNLAIQTQQVQMSLSAIHVCNIASGETVLIKDFIAKHVKINAIAGIGDPARFFDTLRAEKFQLNKQQGFVDHHKFTFNDFNHFNHDLPLLMTEKDAVKCGSFAQAHWWYLPVNAEFSVTEQQLLQDKLMRLCNA
ncbi:MAG: tetraacyldisaccharide 4'-kinase [Colwellia sp.]